jgi:hypothetical protein
VVVICEEMKYGLIVKLWCIIGEKKKKEGKNVVYLDYSVLNDVV